MMARKLVYDVAVSIDGYIAGPGGDVSGFLFEGDHVEDYQKRLASYDTVIMGRETYVSGYQYGMKPGDAPYAHMRNMVFSSSLSLPAGSPVEVVREGALRVVDDLKAGAGGDVYVCGGGAFAGWLMKEGRLDSLILKINPVVLGGGTPMLAGESAPMRLVDSKASRSGVVLARYEVLR